MKYSKTLAGLISLSILAEMMSMNAPVNAINTHEHHHDCTCHAPAVVQAYETAETNATTTTNPRPNTTPIVSTTHAYIDYICPVCEYFGDDSMFEKASDGHYYCKECRKDASLGTVTPYSGNDMYFTSEYSYTMRDGCIHPEIGLNRTIELVGYHDDKTYQVGESPIQFTIDDINVARITAVQGTFVNIMGYDHGETVLRAKLPDGTEKTMKVEVGQDATTVTGNGYWGGTTATTTIMTADTNHCIPLQCESCGEYHLYPEVCERADGKLLCDECANAVTAVTTAPSVTTIPGTGISTLTNGTIYDRALECEWCGEYYFYPQAQWRENGHCLCDYCIDRFITHGIPADVDLNCELNIADTILLSRFVSEDAAAKLTGPALYHADANGDSVVDAQDITYSILAIAKLLPTEPQTIDTSYRNLMEGKESKVSLLKFNYTNDFFNAQDDFALNLLQESIKETGKDKNVLLSPTSAMLALGMTANGTANDTRSTWEKVLGGGMKIEELNKQLALLNRRLNQSEEIQSANGIWFNNKFSQPLDSFLQNNADYYNAAAYAAPFNDDTLKEVNNFVNENTKGRIPSILDEIGDNDVMYLVNALTFDSKWATEMTDDGEWLFTLENDTEVECPMLRGEAEYSISNDNTIGFIKSYKPNVETGTSDYSFAVLMPADENVSISDYLKALDGEKLRKTIESGFGNPTDVEIHMPQFKTEYNIDMVEALGEMGMALCGDFSNMYDFPTEIAGQKVWPGEEISVGSVLHKTYINVNAEGTEAAAATAVVMTSKTAIVQNRVVANRPYVYMILDNESKLPVFIGTMMDPSNCQ